MKQQTLSILVVGLVLWNSVSFFILDSVDIPTFGNGTTGITSSSIGKKYGETISLEELESKYPENLFEGRTSEFLKVNGSVTEIDGGIWFNTSQPIPECDEYLRGLVWFIQAKESHSDNMLVCLKDESGEMVWKEMII